MKTGIIQQSNTFDSAANMGKLRNSIESCVDMGARLVVMPELHNSLYFCQTEDPAVFDLAESIPGPSTAFFGALAKAHQIVIIASLFEKRAPGLYHNTAVAIDADGSIAGIYRKMHIPDDPAYYEKFYFAPGDSGFHPIQTSIGRIGVLVCWDQWFPEAARLMAMRGASLLAYPTAIGWESTDVEAEKLRQRDAWTTIQRSHAIANGIPVIAVNRCGYEPDPSAATGGITFWGNSFAAGPQGEIIAELKDEEGVMVVDLPCSQTESVRRWWPFFRDRRVDAYDGLSERFLD
ncbi:MAG: carbon-nitrogen hydrolase [Tannerellaceae bacterium]|jgi:N-carbamoylputrescine amidase|nr:carbon-nitrogen hydrolase [Tannerellaceae bacterium]